MASAIARSVLRSALRGGASAPRASKRFFDEAAGRPTPLSSAAHHIHTSACPPRRVLANMQFYRAYHSPATEGIKEIMADYVHQDMSRNWILVCWRLFLLIVIKDGLIMFIGNGDPGKTERNSGSVMSS